MPDPAPAVDDDAALVPGDREPMDIHKPKPAHSWKEFLSEISIVVCGILIALALEQGVELLHERHLAEQSRRDVRQEAAINLALMQGRADNGSCIATRLGEIDRVLGVQAPLTGMWVGRPDDLPMFVERWRSVTSSGRTALFPPDEQAALDNLFAVFGEFRQAELREQAAWTRLKVLERWRGPLDRAGLQDLLASAEEARHEDFEIRRGIFYGSSLGEVLNIAPNTNYGGVKGAIHSVCIPSATSLDKALALQKDRVADPD